MPGELGGRVEPATRVMHGQGDTAVGRGGNHGAHLAAAGMLDGVGGPGHLMARDARMQPEGEQRLGYRVVQVARDSLAFLFGPVGGSSLCLHQF